MGRCSTGDDSTASKSDTVDATDSSPEKLLEPPIETRKRVVQTWCQTRPSLNAIEIMMGSRVKRKIMKDAKTSYGGVHVPPLEGAESCPEEEEAFCSGTVNRRTSATGVGRRGEECISNNVKPSERDGVVGDGVSEDELFPWKKELECLVRGGLPKDLRGEVKLEF